MPDDAARSRPFDGFVEDLRIALELMEGRSARVG
jgi:hypothetical protein